MTSPRSSAIVSWSETSEISWRKAASVASGLASRCSRATPTSSWRFSILPRASIVRSASSASSVPVFSSTRSSSSSIGRSCASAISDSIVEWNKRIARHEAGVTPAASGSAIAWKSVRPVFSACITRRWSDVSPIPRRGRFAIRRSEVASCGLTRTLR
jgi:hypothetical protein